MSYHIYIIYLYTLNMAYIHRNDTYMYIYAHIVLITYYITHHNMVAQLDILLDLLMYSCHMHIILTPYYLNILYMHHINLYDKMHHIYVYHIIVACHIPSNINSTLYPIYSNDHNITSYTYVHYNSYTFYIFYHIYIYLLIYIYLVIYVYLYVYLYMYVYLYVYLYVYTYIIYSS